MNVAAANIAVLPKLPPAATPAVSAGGEAKAAPAEPVTAAAFQAFFKIAQTATKASSSTSDKPAIKGAKAENSQAAILPVFEAFRELLSFGAPTPQITQNQQDGSPNPSVDTLPDAATVLNPKVVSLLGAALLPRGIETAAAAQTEGLPAEAMTANKASQPVFDLKLDIEKPEIAAALTKPQTSAASPATPAAPEAPAPAVEQQAPQAAAILASAVLPSKQSQESDLQAPQKADSVVNTPAIETSAPAKSSSDSHQTTAPARVERPSEVLPAEPRTVQTASPKEITLRLSDLQQRSTDVRLVDRGGQVHVSVRTSDAEFGRTLRGGLNELMTKLDHAGIRAELARGSDGASLKNNTKSPGEEQQGSGQRRDQKQRQQNGSDAQSWLETFQSESDGETTL